MSPPTPPLAPTPPPARIGIIGGGQLGRMLGIAARRLGFDVWVLDPTPDCPTAAVADRQLTAEYGDTAALAQLAEACEIVTFEFENVPADALHALEARVRVHPSARVLETCRHRIAEKTFLGRAGVPVAEWREVHRADQLADAVRELGGTAIVKSAEFGYDGKGQRRLTDPEHAARVWRELDVPSAVAEAIVPFDRELSILVARSSSGETTTYPLAANVHANHVLHTTHLPAPDVSAATAERARELALRIAEQLDLVGLLCVELFQTGDDLLVNELAPRPHNSGHATIEAAVTCQFENHVRAICGLPLGSTRVIEPRAMLNLMGELWVRGEPDWRALLAIPELELHLYGKRDARAGRKMGHATMPTEVLEQALAWAAAPAGPS